MNESKVREEFLDKEMCEERREKQELWSKHKSQSQEIAILRARLELANKEISHRTKMFGLLKNEAMERARDEAQRTRDLLSSKVTREGLEEMMGKEEERIRELKEELRRRNEQEEKMEKDVEKMELLLRSRSIDIERKSDRLSGLKERLGNVEGEIEREIAVLRDKEAVVESLRAKISRREKQLEVMAMEARKEKMKAYDLDTTLKVSAERERRTSQRVRLLKMKEETARSECALIESRIGSLRSVIRSRGNIIGQLETERRKADEEMRRLFEETSTTELGGKGTSGGGGYIGYSPSIEDCTQGDERSMSLSSVLSSNVSLFNANGTNDRTDLETMSMLLDGTTTQEFFHLGNSLAQDNPQEGEEQEFVREEEEESAKCKRSGETEKDLRRTKVGECDTDSGLSTMTPSLTSEILPYEYHRPKHQSTPRKETNRSPGSKPAKGNSISASPSPEEKFNREEKIPLKNESKENNDNNRERERGDQSSSNSSSSTSLTTAVKLSLSPTRRKSISSSPSKETFSEKTEEFLPPPSSPGVSINIFQSTGRVRHNSLPSSAGKNRYRYRSKLQEEVVGGGGGGAGGGVIRFRRNLQKGETQEQSSQTLARSFLLTVSTRTTLKEEERTTRGKDLKEERLPADGFEPKSEL